MLSAYSGGKVKIENLSQADDTQILKKILASTSPTLHAGHGGTTFRFIAPWLALQNKNVVLTGSPQLVKRPIGPLVNALRSLGTKIEYQENEGFPPIRFSGFQYSGKKQIVLNDHSSSQWTSSLLLAAASFPEGLQLEIGPDEPGSASYLNMSLKMLAQCGIITIWEHGIIKVARQPYLPTHLKIENDWSSASYWLAMATLRKGSQLKMNGLKMDSLQGDASILSILEKFGLQGSFENEYLKIIQPQSFIVDPKPVFLDLRSFPDLAQTLIAMFVIGGQSAQLIGLQSLEIKESNRLLAMKSELKKMGVIIEIDTKKGTCFIPGKQKPNPPNLSFETYHDHRMAMALSLFSFCFPISIQNPEVVSKSYPTFWEEMSKMGFQIDKLSPA